MNIDPALFLIGFFLGFGAHALVVYGMLKSTRRAHDD